MTWPPRKGDWVTVKAMVVDPDPHPEELKVQLESHNEHYYGLVRRDRCEPAEPPPWLPKCPSLYNTVDDEAEATLVRCRLHAEHAGDHEGRGERWTDREEYGTVEQ